jgi:large subunit ribosomal protein L18Ae
VHCRYFLKRLKRVKKANGEIISITVISEKRPKAIKNYGIA